jgi:hypothetical protein
MIRFHTIKKRANQQIKQDFDVDPDGFASCLDVNKFKRIFAAEFC